MHQLSIASWRLGRCKQSARANCGVAVQCFQSMTIPGIPGLDAWLQGNKLPVIGRQIPRFRLSFPLKRPSPPNYLIWRCLHTRTNKIFCASHLGGTRPGHPIGLSIALALGGKIKPSVWGKRWCPGSLHSIGPGLEQTRVAASPSPVSMTA